MSPSLEFIERCSAQTGFQIAPLEKVIRLGEMAGDIRRHPFLGGVLALKGGTAINLCFGPPQRLSVDLDFNFIGDVDREKMLEERPQLETVIIDLAQRRGYLVQRTSEAFAGGKFYLRYRSVLGQQDRIEIDINFMFRVPLAETEKKSLWQPGGLDQPRVLVVGLEELWIGKLLALLNRCAAKDVWDTANSKGIAAKVVESGLFRARFLAMAAVLDHPLPSYGRSRFERLLTDRIVVEQLGPMLAQGRIPSANELIERSWTIVHPFLNLDAREEEYFKAINRGELKAEYLFPDTPDEAAKFNGHPAILWKVANVQKNLKRTNR